MGFALDGSPMIKLGCKPMPTIEQLYKKLLKTSTYSNDITGYNNTFNNNNSNNNNNNNNNNNSGSSSGGQPGVKYNMDYAPINTNNDNDEDDDIDIIINDINKKLNLCNDLNDIRKKHYN
jgi:hypothetical protein